MPDALLSKDAIIKWLDARAATYGQDAEALERYLAEASDPDPGLEPMPALYREIRSALITEARGFADHGPLPPLPEATRRKAISHAARCPVWPDGCGELARYERGEKGPAVVYHRPGCYVDAAIRADAEHDLKRVYVGADGATWHCNCGHSGQVKRTHPDDDLTLKAESAYMGHARRAIATAGRMT